MSDSFTTVTHKGYFQRLGESFAGMAFGVVLIIVGCGVLWWNESRAVDAERALAAARDQIVSLESTTPDAANRNKLVHVSGTASASAPVEDPDLAIAYAGALSVVRKVEMYQWVERSEQRTEDKLGGGQETTTVYTYEKAWSETAVDSASFRQPQGHQNPAMPLTSATFFAEDAMLGGFALDGAVLSQLTPADGAKASAVPDGWTPIQNGFYSTAAGGTPSAPQIGDLRASLASVASGQAISVIGRQTSTGFAAWQDEATGYKLLRAALGEKTATMMIREQEADEATFTWILRAAGTVMTIIGFALILGPLAALANVIPFLASIIGGGIALIALGLGLPLSLTVIALAWLTVRPLWGLGMLALAIGLYLGAGYLRRGAGKAQPAAT